MWRPSLWLPSLAFIIVGNVSPRHLCRKTLVTVQGCTIQLVAHGGHDRLIASQAAEWPVPPGTQALTPLHAVDCSSLHCCGLSIFSMLASKTDGKASHRVISSRPMSECCRTGPAPTPSIWLAEAKSVLDTRGISITKLVIPQLSRCLESRLADLAGRRLKSCPPGTVSALWPFLPLQDRDSLSGSDTGPSIYSSPLKPYPAGSSRMAQALAENPTTVRLPWCARLIGTAQSLRGIVSSWT